MTLSEIETANFRLVAQCLNQLLYRCARNPLLYFILICDFLLHKPEHSFKHCNLKNKNISRQAQASGSYMTCKIGIHFPKSLQEGTKRKWTELSGCIHYTILFAMFNYSYCILVYHYYHTHHNSPLFGTSTAEKQQIKFPECCI
jgi:hypothetical protein